MFDARNVFIGTEFPPDAGAKLAEILLGEGPEFPEVDLTQLRAGLLISAFFRAFFERVAEKAQGRVEEALEIRWRTQHAFQQDSIKHFSRNFALSRGAPCGTFARMMEREQPNPREAVFKSTRSSD